MDSLTKTGRHEAVSEYYGSILEKSADLKTNACCTVQCYPKPVQEALELIHPEVLEKYKGYGIDLEAASGEKHHMLPVPAVFIVGTGGIIDFVYANPGYKTRLAPEVLLAAARAAR